MTNDNIAEWEAAYALGALSPEDRRAYEQYLQSHPGTETNEFADMPAILDALSPEEALALLDEDAGVTSLAEASARRERRKRGLRLAAAAGIAAAFLAIGAVVGANVWSNGGATSTVAMPQLQPMAPGAREGVTASLAVTQKGWGTRLDWQCSYTKDWAKDVASYDLVVITKDGAQTVVASWKPSGDDAAGLAAATNISTASIRSVEIRAAGTPTPLAVTTL